MQKRNNSVIKNLQKIIAKRLKGRRLSQRYKETIAKIEALNRDGKWGNRNLEIYNTIFRTILGENILDKLERFYKKSHRKLQILDDGAGKGFFLSELKHLLELKQIPVETTAVSIRGSALLREHKKLGLIDNLFEGPAEDYLPKKHFDAIFSVLGSINYTLPELTRLLFLKYLYALRVEGFACIVLQYTFNAKQIRTLKIRLQERGFLCKHNYGKSNTHIFVIERIA